MQLKDLLRTKVVEEKKRVQRLVKNSGDTKIGDITISHLFRGMRGLKVLHTDISYVDADEGIRMRGFTIFELLERLPRPAWSEVPYLGGLFYLLVSGELPSESDALAIENQWKRESEIPQSVIDVIHAIPRDAKCMTMMSAAVLAMQNDSKFCKLYDEGLPKNKHWEPTFDDSMSLLAKLPAIAAYIYRLKYCSDTSRPKVANWDWCGNVGTWMGIENKSYCDLVKLYVLLHADHESGNVSAHATYLVSSCLADIYYSLSAGLNGLAGPLHGGAVYEVIHWLQKALDKFGQVPSADELTKFVHETLEAGQVIPGYGHAVLRKTDPRFQAQLEFGRRHVANDALFKIADLASKIVPSILQSLGKVANPWPNVDAITGVLQYHYGITQFDYYILLFGISRALGVTANAIWARALELPIERPKSVTTKMLEQLAQKS